MTIPSKNRQKNIITRFFTDENLTKKATLNALASGLDYFAKLVVGFIITPIMVSGLGDYFYGVWQILNRLFSYISTTSSSASPLEWTLAKEQAVENDDGKRQYLGSSLVIWLIFLPITGIIGGIIAWFAPIWMKAPNEYIWQIRVVATIFILMVSTTSLSFIPYAILRGQNQGYRRIGYSVLVFFLNGGLTWLALYLKTGIIGISISYLIQGLIVGVFYLLVCRTYIPWFGIKRPPKSLVKHFLGLSWWFLASDVVANITFASDVVILGLLGSVESVTSYTLTKYIPETVISIIAIIVVGIIPGLGGIIGTGDLKKAIQVRGEMFTITWLIIIVMGTTILVWNRTFLDLWVGMNRYSGTIPNLLIVAIVTQFVMIRTDGNIIDLTLRIERKVLFGALSVAVSIVIGSILVKFFDLGVVGVCIGLILGRSILSITYPKIISRFLGISFLSQLKSSIRPASITLILFIIASKLDNLNGLFNLTGFKGWIILILGVIITVIVVFLVAFATGLSSHQRKKVLSRMKLLIST